MNEGVFTWPGSENVDVVLRAKGARGAGSTTKNWDRVTIPARARFLDIIAIGAGAGGGGGFTRSAGVAGGGGGGGGSGAIVRARFPTKLLPPDIWVQVPRGGLGG